MVTETGRAPSPCRRPRRTVQIVMVLVVLFSGAVLGSGGTIVLLRHRLVHAQQPGRPASVASAVAAQMQREYSLTAEQTRRVEQALQTRLRQASESRRQFFLRVGAARDGFLADAREILTPAQYERMEERSRTRERRFRWFFGLAESPEPEQLDPQPAPPTDAESQ